MKLATGAELRVTGTNDPIPGCVIHLDSPDAWLLLANIAPSQVASAFLNRVQVNGANAALDSNVALWSARRTKTERK